MTVKFGAPIRAEVFFEVICAVHLSSYVEGPWQSRGGLMVVGPPNALKTTFLKVAAEYPNAFPLTDLNSVQLGKMKTSITAGEIRTLVFTDIQKLFERHSFTAGNLEGNIRALVDEGFQGAKFDSNQRVNRTIAKAGVIAALTNSFYDENADRWLDNGFARRFLWAFIKLNDPEILAEAVEDWEKLEFGNATIPPIPTNQTVPNSLTKQERHSLYECVKFQYGRQAIPYQLICKIACVLRWYYQRIGKKENAVEICKEFASCLSRDTEGSEITGLTRKSVIEAGVIAKRKPARKRRPKK